MLVGRIESLLFVSPKPLSIKKLALALQESIEHIESALAELQQRYSGPGSGIVLVRNNDEIQLTTHPDNGDLVAEYIKEEALGELTKPSLETLTIVAYRGPVTKADIEHIRGVNVSQSLRSLLMRGLIEEQKGDTPDEYRYIVASQFLNHLGISHISELPDYSQYHDLSLLDNQQTKTDPSSVV